MLKEFDNSVYINILRMYIDEGSTILELGSGTGADLDILSKHYNIIGSDNSEAFKSLYEQISGHNEFLILDATSFEIEQKFDVIISNKVMIHFDKEAIRSSLLSQHKHLKDEGILVHSFWYGDKVEEFDGLVFNYYNKENLTKLFCEQFDVLTIDYYTEADENDSVYVVARKKQ